MSAEQGYVTISRGRERGMIFTDLGKRRIAQGHCAKRQRGSRPPSCCSRRRPQPAATEESRMWQFMEKVRPIYRELQRKAAAMVKPPVKQREMGYGR